MDTTQKPNKDMTPMQAGGEDDSKSAFVAYVKAQLSGEANTILIVDDSIAIRRIVTGIIQKCCPGITVTEAINGKDGLRKLEEIRQTTKRDPVLIIVDLDMPVMDGWTFVERLRRDYVSRGRSHGIPVVVLSSTEGHKRGLFSRKTIRHVKSQYSPLVAVAKASCTDPANYDAMGEKGLISWIDYFLKSE